MSPEYFEIKRWSVDQGAFFSPDDVDRAADVCVIDRTVRDQLFGAENPIGKVIRVSTLPCQVVATLSPKGQDVSGRDQDDAVILPYTTVMKKIKGDNWLDDIVCSAVSAEAIRPAGQQAAALLRDRHHLRPDEDDDFNIRNPEDIIKAQIEASRTLTLLLVAIASISLVGGAAGVALGVVGSTIGGKTLGWPMKFVTHENDIAQFARRVIVFRDGRIRKDEATTARPRAEDVLATMPTLED